MKPKHFISEYPEQMEQWNWERNTKNNIFFLKYLYVSKLICPPFYYFSYIKNINRHLILPSLLTHVQKEMRKPLLWLTLYLPL